MSQKTEVFLRRGRKGRRGQILVLFTLSLPLLFGITALVVDFGRIYYFTNELNNSTQAAALAGAYAMSLPGATTTSATTAVTTFSGTSSNDNAVSNLPSVSVMSGYPKFKCLSTLTSAFSVQCWGPSNSNAIQVAQQVKVPLLFLPMFGGTSATLTSTATAAMRGAVIAPYNVAIIVDSTQSMTNTDSDSYCNSTRMSCALAGVRILLQSLSPCLPTESSCGTVTNNNVANSVDRVSLFTFPAVSTASVADDYNCGSSSPTIEKYQWSFPATSTYQIVGFSSDYRTSDTASTLSSSSNIVKAAGGKSGCTGMQAIGGVGTYYPQVIYQAQAALVAAQALNANSSNVLIILGDGDANGTSANMPGANTTGSPAYPSTKQQCHQAITAAQAAGTAGTRVYSVAYGATASGCTTDTSPTITPCQTMQHIASSPSYFFSDYTATGGSSSCISASQPVTGLNQIFQAIFEDLTEVKLIPNNTT